MCNLPPLEKTDMFQYLDFSSLSGGYSAACERLPNAPAVYAFFRKIQLSEVGNGTDFVHSLLEAVRQPSAPLKRARIGPLHHIELHSFSELSLAKQHRLEVLAEDARFRNFITRIIDTSSLLQAPLYVGKTENLQTRIKQHLEPMSDLNSRLREVDIALGASILAYTVVDDGPEDLSSDVMFLIEEVISRICRPGFVSRIG